jgi:hypothetical protein
VNEINKEYFDGFGRYIDGLTDEELMELLEESGLNECPMEDAKEKK